MPVHEHTIELAQSPVFFRRADGDDALLYLHGVPTSSDDWVEMLEQTGGVAPDLPGFGRSGKAGNLDYSLQAYVTFLQRFLDEIDLQQVTLIGHGWGATIGLCFAERYPERVERIAVINGVPLVEGFEWPALARWWRRPPIGELVMGSLTRWLLARLLRGGCAHPEAWTDPRVDAIWEQFDQGTQRAILRLHRSVDGTELPAVEMGLGERDALVVWGERDPWLPASFADAYAQRLGGASVERVPDAGHWPWLEDPNAARRLAAWAVESEPA